ncbi:general amino acid permease 1 [Fomitiporia mediterranea MF3/22]|uniref:general amino acid permease 1 n=1 Tax=Fomitiporia mediterranea (strain MF3/22) TaxID=694068 RepID=UPI0004409774|nr:general amino acid permease 1 [Fomitiporia mediterranea MF3/22]EJD07463.1 general amino acid permease 1 [Fomitiporia mediterranea MF3/22]
MYNEKDEKDLHSNSDNVSLEKGLGDATAHAAVVEDERYHFDAVDLDRVQRRLKQRHVQMIAIAGTLGTGLFLGSGQALHLAGPLGALLAYALVGSVAYSSLCAIGEMTAHAPISGTFPHFAARWVDPALGFAVGWNYFYSNAITVPVEVTAAQILLTFWDQDEGHAPIYTAVICICVCLINIFGVRWFGESEFFFSIIKILLITGLIITGLVVDLGGGPDHQRIGFRYWKNPGALAQSDLVSSDKVGLGRFLALLSVLVQAAFSFQGMELVAIAASETESPRRNISKAVRRVFYRILVFYMLGIFITGLLIPFNDGNLLSVADNAAQSPYVIAFNRAGIKVLPHIINGAVFTSAFSAGNSFLFCSSRILYGLAIRGQAPRIFSYCTKNGLPIVAVLTTSCFAFLAFMNTQASSEQVFNWFVNLTTVAGFFTWLSINLTFIYFYRGKKAQGFDRTKSAYYSGLQPYLSYWGVFWCILFILINGFAVFFDFNASDFLVAYLDIPLFFLLYFGWKIYKRTKFWKPQDMDFVTGIPTMEETEIPEEPPRTIGQKIAAVIF